MRLFLPFFSFLIATSLFGQQGPDEGNRSDAGNRNGIIVAGLPAPRIDQPAGQSTDINGIGPDSESAQLSAAADMPRPGDVLNPDKRVNTPNLKIAIKGGINRTAYSNDRFIDNHPFDVGNVSGEEDVYGSAAGFGTQFGIEVEIPRNTFFSWTVGLRLDHAAFGDQGAVNFPCVSAEGDSIGATSFHRFNASIDYLKLAGAAKVNFQSFYLMMGLTGSTPLSSSIQFKRDYDGAPCYYMDPNDMRNSSTPVEIPNMSRAHFAFRLGGGVTWELTESIEFSPELTLDFGINALNKSPESDLGIYALSGVVRVEL